MIDGWRQRAQIIKRDTLTLYLACRHPGTPWYAKVLAGAVVGYAFSPIDLIPDFVPVLGYLDDLLLVPAGIALAVKLIPAAVLAECREQAATLAQRPVNRVAAVVIAGVWIAAALFILRSVLELLNLI